MRFSVNLKDANKALTPERYPLPSIEALTMKVAGATVFSKTDLQWGYLRLGLSKDRICDTQSSFQFVHLPFGLATGPSACH